MSQPSDRTLGGASDRLGCVVVFRVIGVRGPRRAVQVIVVIVGMTMSVTMPRAVLMSMFVRVFIRLHDRELHR